MLDFILSKLNLLILVTAIFAIVGFFTLGLGDLAELNQAKELASRLKEKSFALATSSSYCFSDSYPLPNELTVSGEGYYYVMRVSKTEVSTDSGSLNVLIFSVYPRSEIRRWSEDSDYGPKSVAAQSFRTSAEIHLYSADYRGDFYENSITEMPEEIFIDPQARTPANTIEFIREVQNGQPHLYVIACNGPLCSANKTEVGERVHPPQGNDKGGFRC